jgi:DnaJ-class molecular chaperone
MNESFYDILGVQKSSTMDEIKKAYRKLSMIHHPDKNNNSKESEDKFKKINEAYETLGNEENKRLYDMQSQNPFLKMMGGQFPGNMFHQANESPFDEILSSIFGMPFDMNMNMNMNMNNNHNHNEMQMPFGFNNPNITIFRNGMPINVKHGLQKPTPIIKTIHINLSQIFSGTTIPLDIERWIIENGNKVFEHETVYVDVPQGIDDGEIIIINNKGNVVNENCKGDIKIFIKIENTTEFKRIGLDLLIEKNITLKEALCGFTFELKYITGKTYTLTNSLGNIINNGYKKIIPNMGFIRDNHKGNLVIVFNVVFPEKLSNETIEILKNLDF